MAAVMWYASGRLLLTWTGAPTMSGKILEEERGQTGQVTGSVRQQAPPLRQVTTCYTQLT